MSEEKRPIEAESEAEFVMKRVGRFAESMATTFTATALDARKLAESIASLGDALRAVLDRTVGGDER